MNPVTRRILSRRLHYPFPAGAPLGRIDNGVDYAREFHGPVYAIAASTVTKIDPVGGGSWGGLGAVYFQLEKPIEAQGNVYHGWYTAESGLIFSSVHVGARVRPGQAVAYTRSGWQETGFAPQPSYNSQVPTRAGEDFVAFILWLRKNRIGVS